MGAAEKCSILYLESRCVSLARALGSQGVQNGGIDGVGVVASVPDGMKELLAENLMVMMRDWSPAQATTASSPSPTSDAARTRCPVLLAGADFIFSGFGSIPRYDNAFALSNFNSDDMDDFLVLQRDWGVGRPAHGVGRASGTGAPPPPPPFKRYRDLGLADFDDERIDEVVVANDSRDLSPGYPKMVAEAAAAIEAKQLTVFDVIASLKRTGFDDEAESIMRLTRKRLRGDQLQTSAIFDENFRVLSKLTDPNDYAGPGTGYALTEQRRAEIDNIRQARTAAELTADQDEHLGHLSVTPVEPAQQGSDPREVCIGLSPALGRTVWLSRLTVGEVLRQISAGLERRAAYRAWCASARPSTLD
jgi:propanediol dehydratase large subunit